MSISLNAQQEECLNQLDGPILILSGAGTGKTRVITQRFLRLIEKGVSPFNILCVTFTNKAANEILNRITKQLQERNYNLDGALWVGTFHRICFKILQIFGVINNKTSIIDEVDQKKIGGKLKIDDFISDIQKFKEDMPVEQSPAFKMSLKKYTEFIELNNMIDFGDIIIKTIKLLEENTEAQSYTHNKFKYIMVDEYQDTSKLQNKLLNLMLNVSQNICCVGDDDQSIYSWRGACIENILTFPEVFQSEVFKLERNYRSNKNIINVANAIINSNTQRLKKRVWTENISSHKVEIHCTKNEGKIIAQEILKLDEKINVGILVRSSMLIRPIEEELIKAGITYKIIGGVRFFESADIKLCISYLKALFLNDVIAIENMLSAPRRGIGDKKMEIIFQSIKDSYSFADALRFVKCYDLADSLERWLSVTTLRPQALAEMIFKEAGIYTLYPERTDNLNILLNKIAQFKTINEFLENLFTLDLENNSRISIMTIHASKGLEFDAVFIPGLIEKVFPNYKSIFEGNIEEERRLAYVAVTRAKHRLFLTYNLSNSNFSPKTGIFGPSRFLFNLPNDSIKFFTS
jgi:DNA helicase-2/ATP-dependent DNA helicase PcrA